MWKGCLLLLGTLGLALYVEHGLAVEKGLPQPWIATSVLGISVMLFVGSLHGFVDAFRKRLSPESDPSTWRDGQLVRVGGVVRPLRQPILAPFSQKQAILCEYKMWQTLERGRETLDERNDPTVRGLEMVPCTLMTATASVELRGVPPLRNLPIQHYRGEAYYPSAARVLAKTQWSVGDLGAAMAALGKGFSGDAFQAPQHLVSRTVIERLFAPPGEASAATWAGGPPAQLRGKDAEEALIRRMQSRAWDFHEQIIESGAEITVEGTYQANPPSINIAQSIRQPQHSVRLGLARQTASREWLQTLVFVLIVAAIVFALHYVAFADGGALYRDLVAMVEEGG